MKEDHRLIIYSTTDGQTVEKIVNEDIMIPDTHEYLVRFLQMDISNLVEIIENQIRNCKDIVEIMDEIRHIHPYFDTGDSAALSCLAATIAEMNVDTDNRFADYYKDDLQNAQVHEETSIEKIKDLHKEACLFVRYNLDYSDDIMKKYSRSTRIALYSLAEGSRHGKDNAAYTWRNTVTVSKELDALSSAADVFGMNGAEISRILTNAALSDEEPSEQVIRLADSIEKIKAAEYHKDIVIPTFADLIWYELYSLLSDDVHFGRCAKCGRYFPITNENSLYCDIRDKDGTSCYTRHMEENRIMETQKIYRKHYHRHLMRVKTGLEEKEVFQRWNRDAVEARKYANKKHLLPEEYEQIISKKKGKTE